MHILRSAARCLAASCRSRLNPLEASKEPSRRHISSVPTSTLMYFGGPCQYQEDDWQEVESFVEENPILDRVPTNRLFVPDVNHPYLCSESGKSLIRSGVIIPYVFHSRNISTQGLFQKENVRVLKKFGVLGLRQVPYDPTQELDVTVKQKNYFEVSDFFQKLLVEKHGNDVLQQLPPDLAEFFLVPGELPLDEELIVNNAALLPRLGRAVLIMRIYIFLLREAPLRLARNITLPIFREVLQRGRKPSQAIESILNSVLYTDSYTEQWTEIVQRHTMLKCWVPKISKKAKAAQKKFATPEGLLTMHRHGVVHPVEKDVLDLIDELPLEQIASLTANPHTFEDVIDLYHYSFPELLFSLQKQFKEEGLYEVLKILDLFPAPSSYE